MGTFIVGTSRLRGGDRLRAEATPAAPGLSVGVLGAIKNDDGFRFTGGRTMNALARAAMTPTCSPPEDPLRPIHGLFDGRPGSPFRFGSVLASPHIDADLNMMPGSGGHNQTDEANWTEEYGSALDLNLEKFPGGAFQLLSSQDFTQRALGTSAYQDVLCRPGETLRLTGQAYGGGSAAEAALIRIQNLANGKWLTASGAWQVAPASVVQQDALDWSAMANLTFQVEGLAACNGYDEVHLRWRMARPGGATYPTPAFFRDMALWPAVGFIGAWWSNILGAFTIRQEGSETGKFSGEHVLLATLIPRRGVTFFDYSVAPQVFRFHRIMVDGGGYTMDRPIQFGEIVLAMLQELSPTRIIGPRLDAGLEARFQQARFSNASGATYVYQDLDHRLSKASLSFMLSNDAELVALRDALFGVGKGGALPSIITGLDEMGEDLCLFGRFEDNLPMSFPGAPVGRLYVKGDLVFNEEPGPLT